jgi:hypothetical protein
VSAACPWSVVNARPFLRFSVSRRLRGSWRCRRSVHEWSRSIRRSVPGDQLARARGGRRPGWWDANPLAKAFRSRSVDRIPASRSAPWHSPGTMHSLWTTVWTDGRDRGTTSPRRFPSTGGAGCAPGCHGAVHVVDTPARLRRWGSVHTVHTAYYYCWMSSWKELLPVFGDGDRVRGSRQERRTAPPERSGQRTDARDPGVQSAGFGRRFGRPRPGVGSGSACRGIRGTPVRLAATRSATAPAATPPSDPGRSTAFERIRRVPDEVPRRP